MKTIGGYTYKKSNVAGKKLSVVVNGKIINFGDSSMDHYKDKTGIWKSKDHLDEKRRKSYLARSGGIKRKDGTLTKNDPTSSNYHSRKILWNG
tara:strand:- start:564 stop:842 length:279 start_codon:yes stop_codon:yes gene_type:complete